MCVFVSFSVLIPDACLFDVTGHQFFYTIISWGKSPWQSLMILQRHWSRAEGFFSMCAGFWTCVVSATSDRSAAVLLFDLLQMKHQTDYGRALFLRRWSNGTSCLCVMWQEIRSHDGTLTALSHLTQISFLEAVSLSVSPPPSPSLPHSLSSVYLQVHQLDMYNTCIYIFFLPKSVFNL